MKAALQAALTLSGTPRVGLIALAAADTFRFRFRRWMVFRFVGIVLASGFGRSLVDAPKKVCSLT